MSGLCVPYTISYKTTVNKADYGKDIINTAAWSIDGSNNLPGGNTSVSLVGAGTEPGTKRVSKVDQVVSGGQTATLQKVGDAYQASDSNNGTYYLVTWEMKIREDIDGITSLVLTDTYGQDQEFLVQTMTIHDPYDDWSTWAYGDIIEQGKLDAVTVNSGAGTFTMDLVAVLAQVHFAYDDHHASFHKNQEYTITYQTKVLPDKLDTVEETGLTNGWYQTGLVYGDQVSDSTATPTINAGDTDEVTITNTKGISINVTKEWTKGGNAREDKQSISFKLYQVLTPVGGGTALAPTEYTTGTVRYTVGTGWETVTIPNLPLIVTRTETTGEGEGATTTTIAYNASYYVEEDPVPAADAGYVLATTYSNENGAVNPAADASSKALNAGGTITIINTETAGVELPATGGTGTVLYTASGLTLLLGAALWLFLRRRREQN